MDNEILKHPDCPFDVIVRDGNGLLRHKRTQSLEPASPEIVLMALLVNGLANYSEPITGTINVVNPVTELVDSSLSPLDTESTGETSVDETTPSITRKTLK